MDTGRADLNSLIKVASIPQDEPVFILRGQDALAGPAVRAWAALAAIEGAPPAVLESALLQADRMDAWPAKKLPQDDHLEPHQRQQLEYQHQRRLWAGGEGAPWRLAELRGHLPENPPALMRQLAAEQQAAGALYIGKATGCFAEAGSRKTEGETRSAAWFDNRRQAAAEAANRAAYFLAIATCLHLAAALLEPAGDEPAAREAAPA